MLSFSHSKWERCGEGEESFKRNNPIQQGHDAHRPRHTRFHPLNPQRREPTQLCRPAPRRPGRGKGRLASPTSLREALRPRAATFPTPYAGAGSLRSKPPARALHPGRSRLEAAPKAEEAEPAEPSRRRLPREAKGAGPPGSVVKAKGRRGFLGRSSAREAPMTRR